jgi:transposase-like protein
MMIVLPLLVAIKDYLTKYQDESPDMEIACPYCGHRLRRHGRYFRRVVLGTVLYRVPVYRRLCPRCRKTFSLCPCFLRPYSQFAQPVHEAAARLLVQGRSPDRVSELLCQGPEAGGVSKRTILRWQRRWKDGASSLLSTLSERVLALSPGTDLTPYLPPPRMPRGSLQALFSLGGLYRDTVWGPRRPPLFPFLRLSLPSGAI